MRKKIITSVVRTAKKADKTVTTVEQEVGALIEPVRKTALTRFPILFALLVTFGVAITFLGFERVVVEIEYINQRPLLMLSIGIGVLALTGTLYKKLG